VSIFFGDFNVDFVSNKSICNVGYVHM
jgi:hypothetical protein